MLEKIRSLVFMIILALVVLTAILVAFVGDAGFFDSGGQTVTVMAAEQDGTGG